MMGARDGTLTEAFAKIFIRLAPIRVYGSSEQMRWFAAWFAGWPGSTFTRLLGAFRGDDYFVVCPRSIARFDAQNGAFVGHHEFCVLRA